MAKPDVVFADEPTGNLDTKTTREVMHLFLSFARKQQITIVQVTHDQNLARYADRIVTIVDGEVIKDVLNDSLYDITLRLEEEFAGKIKENASVEALAGFSAGNQRQIWRRCFRPAAGDGSNRGKTAGNG